MKFSFLKRQEDINSMYLISDKSSQLNNHKSLDGNRHLLTEVWIKGVLILSHTTTLYQTVCTSNGK